MTAGQQDRKQARPRFRLAIATLALCLSLGGAAVYVARRQDDPNPIAAAVQADIEAGRLDRAEAGLTRLSRLQTPTTPVWMLRALLAEKRGRVAEAVADLAQVADDDPLGPRARLKEAELERRRHHFRAAEAALVRALKADPQLKPARLALIYLDSVKLRQAELRDRFRTMAELGPLTSRDLLFWCRDWNAVEKPDEAVAVLGPVVAADPGDRQSRLVLVEGLRLLGRSTEADALLSVLPATDPDALAARVRMALDRGDEAAADALLVQGPVEHPGLARLRGRRALARREPAEAVRQFEIARRLEPDDRDTLFGLGHALRLAGRASDAEPFLRTTRHHDALSALVQRVAEARSVNDRDLLMRFGAACEALGRLPEARAWYNLVIARDPLDTDAQKALYRLRPSS